MKKSNKSIWYRKGTQVLLALLFLSGIWLTSSQQAIAVVLFPNGERNFIVEKSCEAFTSYQKGSFPIPVSPGEEYMAIGENKSADATFTYIKTGVERRKWLALDCGRYEGESSAPPKSEPAAPKPAASKPAKAKPKQPKPASSQSITKKTVDTQPTKPEPELRKGINPLPYVPQTPSKSTGSQGRQGKAQPLINF